MADDTREGPLTPEEAFSLVGNETRAQIIRVLNEERGVEGPPPVLSFSELYSRIDSDALSSQFNYHLQKLVGHFVEQTEDGYRIRPEGISLYRAVRGGTFVRPESSSPIDVGRDCYRCEGKVMATYEEGEFRIACSKCEHLYLTSTRVPSGTFDDEADLLSRIDQFDRHKMFAFDRGVCPTCANAVETTLVRATEAPFADSGGRDVYVHRSCGRCGNIDYVSVGKALLRHPDVVSFFRERGLDVRTTPQWELEFAMTDHFTTVRSTDPWEVALELTRNGDTLELVVDEELTVVEQNYS